MKTTFFCRHGHVTSGDILSPEGRHECAAVRDALRGICSFETALTSTANRCLQTVHVFQEGIAENKIVIDRELHVFVDYRTFISPLVQPLDDEPPRYNFSNWQTVVELYEEHQPDLVVGHDCMPVILAFKLLERRGIKID